MQLEKEIHKFRTSYMFITIAAEMRYMLFVLFMQQVSSKSEFLTADL